GLRGGAAAGDPPRRGRLLVARRAGARAGPSLRRRESRPAGGPRTAAARFPGPHGLAGGAAGGRGGNAAVGLLAGATGRRAAAVGPAARPAAAARPDLPRRLDGGAARSRSSRGAPALQ